MNKRPLIVAIEGGDYVGKSTTIEAMKEIDLLPNCKYKKQPSMLKTGQLIKTLLLEKDLPNSILATAYALDRAYQEHLFPHNSKSSIYVYDRSIVSSIVMQTDKSFTPEEVVQINKSSTFPDLVIWLRCTERTLRERRDSRRDPVDPFDENFLHWHRMYEEKMPKLNQWLPQTTVCEVWVDEKLPSVIAKQVSYIVFHAWSHLQ